MSGKDKNSLSIASSTNSVQSVIFSTIVISFQTGFQHNLNPPYSQIVCLKSSQIVPFHRYTTDCLTRFPQGDGDDDYFNLDDDFDFSACIDILSSQVRIMSDQNAAAFSHSQTLTLIHSHITPTPMWRFFQTRCSHTHSHTLGHTHSHTFSHPHFPTLALLLTPRWRFFPTRMRRLSTHIQQRCVLLRETLRQPSRTSTRKLMRVWVIGSLSQCVIVSFAIVSPSHCLIVSFVSLSHCVICLIVSFVIASLCHCVIVSLSLHTTRYYTPLGCAGYKIDTTVYSFLYAVEVNKNHHHYHW